MRSTADLSPRRALAYLAVAVVVEIVLILPFVDRLADRDPTFHFTQHGLIFLGGIAIGVALRDIYLLSRR